MCKANSFLLGVLPDIRIMVAERKRVRGLVSTPAHPRVSLSRPTATGGNEMHTRLFLRRNNPDVVEKSGPRRPTGNVASRRRIIFRPLSVKHTK